MIVELMAFFSFISLSIGLMLFFATIKLVIHAKDKRDTLIMLIINIFGILLVIDGILIFFKWSSQCTY